MAVRLLWAEGEVPLVVLTSPPAITPDHEAQAGAMQRIPHAGHEE
jgi:hypothetical protein